jgi:ATP-binding cassette subfamily B protein
MDTIENKSRSSPSLIMGINRRLYGMIWADNKAMVIALIAVFIVASVLPFTRSAAIGLLVNQLAQPAHSVSSAIIFSTGLLLLATVLPPFLSSLQSHFEKIFWFYMGEKFELLLLKRKGEIDVASHEDPKQNDLFVRVQEQGMGYLQTMVGDQFYIFQYILEALIASSILLASNWWLFLLIILTTLPELYVESKYSRDIWGIWSAHAEVKRKYYDLHKHFDDLPALIELKLSQNTGHFYQLLKEIFGSFQNEERRSELLKVRGQLLTRLLSQITVGFTVVYFIVQVRHGVTQVGFLIFIMAAIQELRQSLSGLFYQIGRQYENSLFVVDVFKLLDIPPIIIKPSPGIVLKTHITPAIVFDNVTFVYPGTNMPVLKNFSLTIQPGQKVAFVGTNGVGKSTIVKLLCRFYDPTEGSIYV